VRAVTVSNDKHKYGVQLKAEPDHKVLGARLKGAFKAAMDAIRQLTDDQLTEFQRTGQLEVAGQCLNREDLRLMYTVNAAADKSSAYEAHSDNDVSCESRELSSS
jgi:isoleucyl-tRNA synthetase